MHIDELVVYDGKASLLDNLKQTNRPRVIEDIPQAAGHAFREHREIRHLARHLFHIAQDDEDNGNQWYWTSGGMMRQMFLGLGPSTSCPRVLEQGAVNLRGKHDGLISAMDFTALEELSLFKCRRTEDFRAALKRADSGPSLQLKRFAIYSSRKWRPQSSNAGAGDNMESNKLLWESGSFLETTPDTLQELWICLRGCRELPDAASITRHGKTLTWLFLEVGVGKASSAITYPLEDWTGLCQSLTSVRPLDTSYPPVVVDCRTSDHDEFCRYVVSSIHSYHCTLPNSHIDGPIWH